MGRHRFTGPLAASAAFALLVAGCASTKHTQGNLAAGGTTPGEIGSVDAGPVDSGSGPAGVDPGTPGSPAGEGSAGATNGGPGRGGPTGPAGGGTTASTGGGGTGGSTGGSTARTSHGITATTITIGVVTITGAEELGRSLGGSLNLGDTKAQSQAIIDHINANGGMAGRKVVASYYAIDVRRCLAEGTCDTQGQEACAKWTQDTRVFAVVTFSAAPMNLVTCLARARTPYIADQHVLDNETYQSLRNYFYTVAGQGGFVLERLAKVYVDGLWEQGFFPAGAKVGLLYTDDPMVRKPVDRALKPALAAHGVPVAAEEAIRGLGFDAPYDAYVLNFARAGVTHVLALGGAGGTYPGLFALAAERQGYRPKYGYNTALQPTLTAATVPPEQFVGARVVGWAPVLDVARAQDPGPVSDNETLCMQIMANGRQDMSDRQTELAATEACDVHLFLDALGDNAGDQLTPEGLAAAAARIGTGFASATTWGTRFGAGRPDGVNTIRDAAWDTACKCFRYTGAPRTLP